ncbi:interferon gamma receptor 1-like [Plectropomus leopardus]|uniref:interferon gamma receptor 1-like n=1 Tax=Plectropomus leopardus TaxID=160734 RepID=UPI001C4C059F|nr:interferon gamma receptor 1-like [Plectropomus leopardus]
MDLAKFHPVFLLLCLLPAAVGHVEPPTNVTLHCHNMHNVLKWSYDQLSPGLRFRVNIGSTLGLNGHPQVLWVDPPAPLQADVSFLSDPSNEYQLMVTAVVANNESEPAPEEGIIFSYFKDSQAYQKCSVDFPTVNVTAQQDDTVLLRFTHPWLLYHKSISPDAKISKKKRNNAQSSQQLPVFNYDVQVISQKGHHRKSCVTSVCEEKFSVDPAEKKHCVKVKGEVEKISVKATQEYCALTVEERPSKLVYIAVAGGLLALVAVVVVFIMVFRKKTTPSTSLPRSMTFTNKLKQLRSGVVQDTISVPVVAPASPTPLLTPDEIEPTLTVTPSAEPDLRLPIGLPKEDEGVSVDMEVGSDEGPGYMQGRNLEEDDELCSSDVPSGYEKRAVLVELGEGELVEGYHG